MVKYEMGGKDVYTFKDGEEYSAALEWKDYQYVIVGELSEAEILELMQQLIEKL